MSNPITSSRTNLSNIQNCLRQQTRKLNTELDGIVKMQCSQSAYPTMDRQLRRRTEHHSDRVSQEKALQEDSERAKQMGLRIQQVLEHLRRDFTKIKNHLGTYSFSNADDGSDGCEITSSIDTRQAWKDELCCMIKLVRNYVNLQHLGGFRLLHNNVNSCSDGKVCGACYRPKFKYVTPTGDALCMDDATCVSNPNLDVECLYQQLCNTVLGEDKANIVEKYWYTALVGVVKSAITESHYGFYDETTDCPIRDGYMPGSTRNHVRQKIAEYLSGIFDSHKDKQGHITPSPHALAQAILLTDLPSNLSLRVKNSTVNTAQYYLVYGLNGSNTAATPAVWKPWITGVGGLNYIDSASCNIFTFVEAIWHQKKRTFDVGELSSPSSRTIAATHVGDSYEVVTSTTTFDDDNVTKLFIGGDLVNYVDGANSMLDTASSVIAPDATNVLEITTTNTSNSSQGEAGIIINIGGDGKILTYLTPSIMSSPPLRGTNAIAAAPGAQTPIGIIYGWKYVLEDNQSATIHHYNTTQYGAASTLTNTAYKALDSANIAQTMWSYSTMWPASEVTQLQSDLAASVASQYNILQLTENNDGEEFDNTYYNSFDETRVAISPVTAINSDDCSDANFNFVRGQLNAMMDNIRKAQIVNDCEVRTINSVRDVSECNQAFHENAFGNLTQVNEGELHQRYEVGKQLLRDLDVMYRENCVTKQTFFKDVTINGCL